MYSNKKNILRLVALLQQSGIDHIVLSPGSRNAPLIHTFAKHPSFTCFTVVDERSAAFFAIGMIQKLRRPVAICCTSGTALLNYGSGVAEAFYQQLPLLVISADRPQAWIGQMDGQTLPQPGIFRTLVKKSVQLPEIHTAEEEWLCNRLINETLIELTRHGNGPVHINIPLAEPLFEFTAETVPEVRRIQYYPSETPAPACTEHLKADWQRYAEKMVIVGQASFPAATRELLRRIARQADCVVLAEHTGNLPYPEITGNFDALIYTLPAEEKKRFAPGLVITLGGHIVSKRIKQLLRDNPPLAHWHIGEKGEVPDLFRALTCVAEGDPAPLLQAICRPEPQQESSAFYRLWRAHSDALAAKAARIREHGLPFSDLLVTGYFMEALPEGAVLQLANSSPVRNAQLFPLRPGVEVYCNRGTSGIDGSMSTAVGYASVHDGPVYLLIGDLSYLYDLNSLYNGPVPDNLRIVLLYNNGGEIFRALPGLNRSDKLERYVCQAADERESRLPFPGKRLFPDDGAERIRQAIREMAAPGAPCRYLAVITAGADNSGVLRNFYHQLKDSTI